MSDPRIETLITGRAPPTPTSEDENRRVPAVRVAAFFGVHLRTINRWLCDPDLAFPKPAAIVHGRRYWKARDIIEWERARSTTAEA